MFNRPHVLNAANHQFEEDLREALLEFDTDEEAWVGIIHGAGRAFCAGADIKQRFVELTPQERSRRDQGPNPEGYLGRTANWKPMIAAVHGYALGTGIVIASECDMIVASEEAKFGITETRRGLAGGRIWAKVNAFMPSKIASEMVITGEPVEAAELYRLGLINRLVPTGFHLSAAEALAEKVLKAAPLHPRGGESHPPPVGADWRRGGHADPASKAPPVRGFQGGQSFFRGETPSRIQGAINWRPQKFPPPAGGGSIARIPSPSGRRSGWRGLCAWMATTYPSASTCCIP